jgi:hypothetical protein
MPSNRPPIRLTTFNSSANPNLVPNTQRNLNNAFAYDLVPSPSVLSAALRAARRVNDFPTAVRIFEGTSSKPMREISFSLPNRTIPQTPSR